MEEFNKNQLKDKYQSLTYEQLRTENRKLKNELDKINIKVSCYYEKSLRSLNKKYTGRNTHNVCPPINVLRAEIKNSLSHKRYLEDQQKKLEHTLSRSINRRGKDVYN